MNKVGSAKVYFLSNFYKTKDSFFPPFGASINAKFINNKEN